MFDKTTNTSSKKQSGGITGQINDNGQNVVINTYLWKGRKEGFFSALGLAILVEVFIRLFFKHDG